MPTTDISKQTITAKNFQVWFYRTIHNRSRDDVASMFNITVDAVDYHVNKVNRLGNLNETGQSVQDALPCLVPVAVEALEKKLRDGDVSAINALLKGPGVYVTREKQDVDVHNRGLLSDFDSVRKFDQIMIEYWESRGVDFEKLKSLQSSHDSAVTASSELVESKSRLEQS